ncbi:MAG: HEPN domain-containing protein [Thermodesulfovibrionales bacterium]|nr:HEPN domain-containing protein [Thermodesulfovibrionales bacterium]
MSSKELALSYLFKAKKRLKALYVLFEEEDYSDVIREAQEIVELCLKAMLRSAGIEPPKIHEVSSLLIEHRDRFSEDVVKHFNEISRISKRLRKERELAFYGEMDFIPTEEYSEEDALEAIKEAEFVLRVAEETVSKL